MQQTANNSYGSLYKKLIEQLTNDFMMYNILPKITTLLKNIVVLKLARFMKQNNNARLSIQNEFMPDI